jgi:hypothetical protein
MARIPLLLALAAALALAGCIGAAGPATDAGPAGDDGSDQADEAASDSGSQGESSPSQPEDPSGEYAPGWPSLEEAAVRPGATIASSTCTSNFLFRSPDNRTLYIGAAAHCFQETDVDDPVSVAGTYQGTLAYSSWKTQKRLEGSIVNEDNDFALVELPDDAREDVHPAVREVGGPTGVVTDAGPGDRVLAHGNSSLRPQFANDAGPEEGYVTDRGDWLTSMYFAGPGVPGDSGSAVLAGDGEALGVLVHLEISPQPGSNNAANLDAVLSFANEHGPGTYELVTWETLEDPTLPSVSG